MLAYNKCYVSIKIELACHSASVEWVNYACGSTTQACLPAIYRIVSPNTSLFFFRENKKKKTFSSPNKEKKKEKKISQIHNRQTRQCPRALCGWFAEICHKF